MIINKIANKSIEVGKEIDASPTSNFNERKGNNGR